jgi:hypothetical protein
MKKELLFILLAAVACQSNPGLPVLTDDRTSGVDPIIEALRSYQNFPMVYVQQDSLVYKFFNEEEARADYESNLKTRQQKREARCNRYQGLKSWKKPGLKLQHHITPACTDPYLLGFIPLLPA